MGAECGGVNFVYVLEELDCFAEVLPFDGHGEVDGVEVSLAGEAACEVGSGVGGGVEPGTLWAEEAEVAVDGFGGDVKYVRDKDGDGEGVSEFPEGLFGVAVWHGVCPQVRRNSFMVWLTRASLIFLAFWEAAWMRQAVAMLLITLGMPAA